MDIYNKFSKVNDGGRESSGRFALFVLLVSHDCRVALPRDVTGLSAVCDCGIS